MTRRDMPKQYQGFMGLQSTGFAQLKAQIVNVKCDFYGHVSHYQLNSATVTEIETNVFKSQCESKDKNGINFVSRSRNNLLAEDSEVFYQC